MLFNRHGEKVRLPRKTKKALSKECGPSEYRTQAILIREYILPDFVIINGR